MIFTDAATPNAPDTKSMHTSVAVSTMPRVSGTSLVACPAVAVLRCRLKSYRAEAVLRVDGLPLIKTMQEQNGQKRFSQASFRAPSEPEASLDWQCRALEIQSECEQKHEDGRASNTAELQRQLDRRFWLSAKTHNMAAPDKDIGDIKFGRGCYAKLRHWQKLQNAR